MPGFANTHTHLTMTLARGVFEDLSPPHKPPFSGGLSPIPLPSMSADERRVMAQLGALEALPATGMRFLMAERAYDRSGTEIGDPAPFQLDRKLGEGHMVNIEQLHNKWNGKADGR